MQFLFFLLLMQLHLCFADNKLMADQPYKSFQACKTHSGIDGHCKQAQYCTSNGFTQNVPELLNNLCIIEQTSIGVGCPDELNTRASSSIVSYPQQVNDAKPLSRAATKSEIRSEERGCGLSTNSFRTFNEIDSTSDSSEWPWMVALIRRNFPSSYCAGVLITDCHILTAAHCIYKYNKNEIIVRLGEYSFADKNETRARDLSVSEIRQHIDFDENTYDNDIALLKLLQPVLFNSYIWPVCMPPNGEYFEGNVGTVIGWGSQFFGGPNSAILMEVSIPIWNNRDCQNVFIERISENVICAGAENGGRDACQGDSGGPLLVQFPNKRWSVVGVVSYGIRCGEKNRPGVYTRVNSFSRWIIDNAMF